MRKLIRLNLSATSSNTHVEKIVIDIQTLRIALMIFKGKKNNIKWTHREEIRKTWAGGILTWK